MKVIQHIIGHNIMENDSLTNLTLLSQNCNRNKSGQKQQIYPTAREQETIKTNSSKTECEESFNHNFCHQSNRVHEENNTNNCYRKLLTYDKRLETMVPKPV